MVRRLLVLVLLGGCQLYPEHGTGGFAEHKATLEPPLYWNSGLVHRDLRNAFVGNTDDEFSFRPWLDVHLERIGCADFRLQGLLQIGARDHFPAMVWQIERDRVRVLRLTSAGLEHDALNALELYENGVVTLSRSMRDQAGQSAGDASCHSF